MADNKDIVRRYYDVWATGDPSALEELLADDYVDRNPMPGIGADKASAAQVVTTVTENMADKKLEIGHMIAEGDFVAAHTTMEWTQRGDFMGMIPADGKHLSLETHDFYRLENGKIAEVWHLEDMMSVMGQLGMLPPPPGG